MPNNKRIKQGFVVLKQPASYELTQAEKKVIDAALKECEKVDVIIVKPIVRSNVNPLSIELSISNVKGYTRFITDDCGVIVIPDRKKSEDLVYDVERVVFQNSHTYYLKDVKIYALDRYSHFTSDYIIRGQYSLEMVSSIHSPKPDDLNKLISNQYSLNFKMGYVKSVLDSFDAHFSVVDAIVTDGENILLGRKKSGWCIIGGFADECDADLEAAVRREMKEECNLTPYSVDYLMSSQCNDWRYEGARQPFTTVYVCKVKDFENAKAGDDILEVKVVPIREAKNYLAPTSHHLKYINEYIETKDTKNGSTKSV